MTSALTLRSVRNYGCSRSFVLGKSNEQLGTGFASVNTVGSFPSHLDRLVPDGVRLLTLTREPRTGDAGELGTSTASDPYRPLSQQASLPSLPIRNLRHV